MERFSQRYGYKPVREALQIDSMDSTLRNSLWNVINFHYWNEVYYNFEALDSDEEYSLETEDNEPIYQLCIKLWMYHFVIPIDGLNTDWRITKEGIKNHFLTCEWYEVYDFIEFISQTYSDDDRNKKFREACNQVLEQEKSAYRFVDEKVTPIIDKEEIDAIETAIESESDEVGAHLNRALELFSDRKLPDYRNSIKESISAVESLVIQVTDKKGTLGKLLKELEDRFDLHKSLRNSFEQLYGYTSDGDGIRHALTQNSKADFEDAKFMLVTCSAFVNYVRGKLNQEEKESDTETSSA